MAFIIKNRNDILLQALRKVERNTSLTASGPGSIVRALTEVITTELADFYDVLDFNVQLQLISTAQGRALDLMGSLYNVARKTLTQIATIDKELGSFYFYVDSPAPSTITIPAGAIVQTDSDTYIGETFSYQTTEVATIPTGRTRVWASIRPLYADSIFTAGINTLTIHDVDEGLPLGVLLKCTNPKSISPQTGYEDDDSYRARIIKSVRTAAGGTAEAVRFAALAIPGVRDIIIQNAPYGLGSFQVLVALEQGTISETVVQQVRQELELVRPLGSRMFLREPELLSVDLKLSILFKDNINIDKQSVSRRAKVGVLRYLNTLSIGSTLIYPVLLQFILESSDAILDVSVVEFKANGEELLRRNFVPQADQQLVPGSIEVTYSV